MTERWRSPELRRRGHDVEAVTERAATGALADAIEAVMRANPKDIPDAEHWIAPLE